MVIANSAPIPKPPVVFMLPPPLYFGLAFVAAMALNASVPLALPDGLATRAIGFTLLAAGILLAPHLAITFLFRRTTLNPFARPKAFLTSGLYRLSRNPMYLGLILVYLGGTLLVGSYWTLAALTVPMAILEFFVIPFEEASMLNTFGSDYQAYRQRVRRWL